MQRVSIEVVLSRNLRLGVRQSQIQKATPLLVLVLGMKLAHSQLLVFAVAVVGGARLEGGQTQNAPLPFGIRLLQTFIPHIFISIK